MRFDIIGEENNVNVLNHPVRILATGQPRDASSSIEKCVLRAERTSRANTLSFEQKMDARGFGISQSRD